MPIDTLEEKIFELKDLKSCHYRSECEAEYCDTVKLDIDVIEDFCFDGYNVLLSITGDSLKSKLYVESFNHRCPKDGADFFKAPDQNDLEIMTKSFEEKVIDKLK